MTSSLNNKAYKFYYRRDPDMITKHPLICGAVKECNDQKILKRLNEVTGTKAHWYCMGRDVYTWNSNTGVNYIKQLTKDPYSFNEYVYLPSKLISNYPKVSI